jgi:hypothetical protein
MISPEEFARRWGREQLAPWQAGSLEGIGIPDASKSFLAEAGLPTGVEGMALSFAPDRRGLPTLAEFLGGSGKSRRDLSRYRRLGSNDVGLHFCIDEMQNGAIFAVAPDGGDPVVFVNSGVAELAECLLEYRRQWMASRDEDDAGYAARLRSAVAGVDPAALEADSSWWSVAVEQAGHGFL